MQSILSDPNSTALYLFPTKALTQVWIVKSTDMNDTTYESISVLIFLLYGYALIGPIEITKRIVQPCMYMAPVFNRRSLLASFAVVDICLLRTIY